MKLEDTPEMQVCDQRFDEMSRDYFTGDPINWETRKRYDGKFVVIGAPGPRYYIFSSENGNHSDLERVFQERTESNPRLVRAFCGGTLTIDDKSIRVYGKSETFGPYGRETVRPIIERYAKQHLPNHEIEIL